MQTDADFERPRHPIQVVATRTGLTMDVLRAWERRYSAVVPGRTETRRRRYSDADIERLILLKRAMTGGRSIGQIAALGRDELVALLDEDQAAKSQSLPSQPSPPQEGDEAIIAECLRAVERLDGPGLRGMIADAAIERSDSALIEKVLAPLMVAVGEGWRDGTLRIAHEHLATSAIQWFLGELTRRRAAHDAPVAVMATPAGQEHQVGIMLAAATAVSLGWNVVYLGSDLPAEEIAAAAIQAHANLIGLSVVYPSDDPRLSSEFAMLRRSVPQDVDIVLGGQASSDYAQVATGLGFRVLRTLGDFRDYLTEMNQRTAVS